MIAKHLKKRGSFKDVSFNNKVAADYYVIGTIERFYGQCELSKTSTIVNEMSVHGPYGGVYDLLTPFDKVSADIRIKFSGIIIYRRNCAELCHLEDIYHGVEKQIPRDRKCWSIYAAVNDELKVVAETLARKVEAAIVDSERVP
jgi:hypothetical protein